MIPAWVEPYVGRPWVAGTGECWHRAAEVWREVFGLDVPLVEAGRDARLARRLIADHPERAAWEPAERPQDGDAVLMRVGRRASHIGVLAGPRHVLHCTESAGTIVSRLDRLPEIGIGLVGVYRRAA